MDGELKVYKEDVGFFSDTLEYCFIKIGDNLSVQVTSQRGDCDTPEALFTRSEVEDLYKLLGEVLKG